MHLDVLLSVLLSGFVDRDHVLRGGPPKGHLRGLQTRSEQHTLDSTGVQAKPSYHSGMSSPAYSRTACWQKVR